ncbi:YebC/PmpR family DNA-binding transcriptional regulator [bacterium]|nr:YebC/PmpR family DNA-binding transcriptional regulator [bacterium]
MAGHSHWHGIRHKKELEDKKRSQIFSKLARQISVAARDGDDPETNPKLRMAIEKAKEFRMPNENIERAIKRGAGKVEGENLEEFVYEAIGPGKIAIIIEGITDNKNRALHEIKSILSKNGGKLAQEGSIRWMFERYGSIVIDMAENRKTKEELELLAIEAGAEDLRWRDSKLEIYTKPDNLEQVKKFLQEKEIKIESASLDWVPKEEIEVSEKEKEAIQRLFEALDENDAVQEIYSNLKIS